jgi:serine/threonine-protein kinase RsbW
MTSRFWDLNGWVQIDRKLEKEKIRLDFPGKIEFLHFAATFSREVCTQVICSKYKKIKFSDIFVHDIELCVNEACTNAIKHGGSKKYDNNITLCFTIFENKVKIEVIDRGEGFDIKEVSDPQIKNLPERGYGLFIIRSKMDIVQYNKKVDGNILEMTKFF